MTPTPQPFPRGGQVGDSDATCLVSKAEKPLPPLRSWLSCLVLKGFLPDTGEQFTRVSKGAVTR